MARTTKPTKNSQSGTEATVDLANGDKPAKVLVNFDQGESVWRWLWKARDETSAFFVAGDSDLDLKKFEVTALVNAELGIV